MKITPRIIACSYILAALILVQSEAFADPSNPEVLHVVILIKENHTFDHYFGHFDHEADADPTLAGYDENDIPNMWHLAEEYTLCDNYYASSSHFSFPNHFYLVAAWTPFEYNPSGNWNNAGYWPERLTLADRLEENGLSWRAYTWPEYGPYFPLNTTHSRSILDGHWSPNTQFVKDVKAGILANVTWVTPVYSDHPPADVTLSDNDTGNMIQAIMNSPFWDSTVIFIVEDDFGGFQDHMNTLMPENHDGIMQQWMRVPCIVVSPLVKKGYVCHEWLEHTSILKFVEETFGLQPLTTRDANANYFQDAFEIPSPNQEGRGGPNPILLTAPLVAAIVAGIAVYVWRSRHTPPAPRVGRKKRGSTNSDHNRTQVFIRAPSEHLGCSHL